MVIRRHGEKAKERWNRREVTGTGFPRANDRWYFQAAFTEATEDTEEGLGVAFGAIVVIRVLPRPFAVGFSDHITSVTGGWLTVKSVLSK